MIGAIGRGYVVKGDLYDIAARIKEIDPDYFIFYSYIRRRYEVHSKTQKGNTLAIVVPFDRLDGRTLTLVRKTRVERFDAIMEEQKRENARLDALRVRAAAERAAAALDEAIAIG